ncbi:hypothetical protein BD413DRAFT_65791 [Trametes elegans]|nr:hypothetical protein BD413DRAFT_65791 [Trametes elegans]
MEDTVKTQEQVVCGSHPSPRGEGALNTATYMYMTSRTAGHLEDSHQRCNTNRPCGSQPWLVILKLSAHAGSSTTRILEGDATHSESSKTCPSTSIQSSTSLRRASSRFSRASRSTASQCLAQFSTFIRKSVSCWRTSCCRCTTIWTSSSDTVAISRCKRAEVERGGKVLCLMPKEKLGPPYISL